ncbi:hypothetical protein BDZ45DRAFT_742436 [Acephala macrosclerotiorum]|nr:hypothetical protein BDZ45DRAFT_742436 [Acephala macrosclerotiorum]
MEGLSRLFRNLQDAFAMYSYQIVPTTSTPSDDPASTLVGDEELPFAKYKDDLSASLSLPLGISFLNFETPVPRSLYLISTSSLKTCLQFLIPSFTNSVWKEAHPKPTKISPTAYLNGVRGLAAFFVWNRHFLNDYYRGEPNWGYLSRPQDVWVAQLLIVRLIYAGSFMITIFFVLSSFVLSYKPLRYVRAGEYEKLVKSLSSSVFRRGLRLFLPVCGAASDGVDVFGDLGEAIKQLDKLLNFTNLDDFSPLFIPTLWTLPHEFRGSITVFVCLLGLARVGPSFRIATLASICLYTLYHNSWQTFLFVAGIILAKMRLIRKESAANMGDKARGQGPFFLAEGCYPANPENSILTTSPPVAPLTQLTPPSYSADMPQVFFWSSISSILILLSLENHAPLQWLFVGF